MFSSEHALRTHSAHVLGERSAEASRAQAAEQVRSAAVSCATRGGRLRIRWAIPLMALQRLKLHSGAARIFFAM
jgi:hypothetical protein